MVMVCGVMLFLRLAHVSFRPYNLPFPCSTCGLQQHETDTVQCEASDTGLTIPDEGAD
ncbi:hypothetical protein [Methylobacterium ajmalii]|uniref:Ion transport domain protein, C-terminal n=1 Tax=Methylobacterium aquaticum TaxID=270351 RepID=A0A0C6G176_9HYPH|nr:ion transport domain protein, C-terminal [Methylobacterium aquaticum]